MSSRDPGNELLLEDLRQIAGGLRRLSEGMMSIAESLAEVCQSLIDEEGE